MQHITCRFCGQNLEECVGLTAKDDYIVCTLCAVKHNDPDISSNWKYFPSLRLSFFIFRFIVNICHTVFGLKKDSDFFYLISGYKHKTNLRNVKVGAFLFLRF